MGGRGRSRTQRKHFRQSRENVWKRSKSDDSANAPPDGDATIDRKPSWEPFATQNPCFDEYYKEQEIVPTDEWDAFVGYLRKPLPAAFRINSSSQFYEDIRLQLENDFVNSLQAEDIDGNEVEAIKPLPWYPDNLAWQSNFSRNELRKNQALERFHEFLKLENEIGNITRQEAVSMVPPLFLDVHPDHFVLDMCAAPGSKTFQLQEMIYKLAEPGTLPSGMVIANDLDVQRCNLLIHQTKRMCTANLIVTNHEAQHFPSCHLHRKHLADSQNEHVKTLGIHQLQFDRVLCDVPCSGDGTLRKAPDIWRKWNAGMGNGLHGLQVQIAMRGVALLKVGGRMVYSTCSMNPVENEAVVAEVLRRCAGSVELVDVSYEIPQLVRRPGLKKWKVRDKGLWLASYKAVPKHRRSVVTPSMFPSGNSYVDTCEHCNETENRQLSESKDVMSSEDGPQGTHTDVAPSNNLEAEISTLPLEHCMRIAPHDQNSGAFFIAIFHKVSSLLANERKCTNPPEETDHNSAPSHKQIDEVKEDPNAFDIDSSGASDVQILEPIHDTELLDNVIHEAPLDTDHDKIDKDNAREETKVPPKGKRKLQIQGRWKGVDPVTFYKDDSAVDMIMEFYGIKENFPFKGHLVTRNNDSNHVKRVYYVSSSVRRVLELNFVAGQQLKISSVGLKMFERQTSKEGTSAPCMFRISSEGLPLILPNVTKQILYVTPLDFKHLLQHKTVKFSDFVNPEVGEKASQLMLGCCVVFLSRDSSEANATPIAIGCWRGRTNVAVMVSALDCQELLERVSVLLTIEAEQKVDEQKKINPSKNPVEAEQNKAD